MRNHFLWGAGGKIKRWLEAAPWAAPERPPQSLEELVERFDLCSLCGELHDRRERRVVPFRRNRGYPTVYICRECLEALRRNPGGGGA